MTVLRTRWAGAGAPAVRLGAAAGLLLALAACASDYRTACIAAGKPDGSAELAACVQQMFDSDRANREAHFSRPRGR